MTHQEVLKKVSKKLDLPFEVVDRTYKAYWLSIRHFIQELPFQDELSEEQFSFLRTSVNIPSLGKLSVTYDRYKGIKNKIKYIKEHS